MRSGAVRGEARPWRWTPVPSARARGTPPAPRRARGPGGRAGLGGRGIVGRPRPRGGNSKCARTSPRRSARSDGSRWNGRRGCLSGSRRCSRGARDARGTMPERARGRVFEAAALHDRRTVLERAAAPRRAGAGHQQFPPTFDVRFVAAGGGPLAAPLARMAEALAPGLFAGERVRVRGELAHADAQRELERLDRRGEPAVRKTFGVATVEAMAAGAVVVGCGVGGLAEIVRHGRTGVLIDCASDDPAGTTRRFADAVERLLARPAERAALSARAAEAAAERYSAQRFVERFAGFFLALWDAACAAGSVRPRGGRRAPGGGACFPRRPGPVQ